MKRFNWNDVASHARVVELATLVGLTLDDSQRQHVQRSLSGLLEKTGGLPLSTAAWSDPKQKRVVQTCVSEASRHFLVNAGASAAYGEGYRRQPSQGDKWTEDIVLCERIALNTADADTLERLPGIGQHLAESIVTERLDKGPFTSFTDLAARVDGIGDETIEDIRPCASMREPLAQLTSLSVDADLSDDLSSCMRIVAQDHDAPAFVKTLEQIAIETARRPHPAFRYGYRRDFDSELVDDDNVNYHDAEIGLLVNSDYYHHLPDALDAAQTSTDICMFHIALPQASHPTHVLLEKLQAAHERGVQVRVLLDRDRPEDPFESTLINTPARDWLKHHGIDCRFDTPQQLLHSKFVLIDASVAIIGSHNWSAGSYFVFDDLSLEVHSAAFVQELSAKFQQLWATAHN